MKFITRKTAAAFAAAVVTLVSFRPALAQVERQLSDYVAQSPYMWEGNEIALWSYPRGFNFDGQRPFVNPSTGQGDMATIQFNGTQVNGGSVTDAGTNTTHVTKMIDSVIGDQVTAVRLLKTDGMTNGSYRTQINSYPILPYKLYALDIEFRLDTNWNFAMKPGDGLLWQLKGVPKTGQAGNPVMGLNLYGNQLKMSVLYPSAALAATSWPISLQWNADGYATVQTPSRTVLAGRYHRVRLMFYADDRPAAFGGQGFITAWFDNKLWFQYSGPTLHPDQKGPHYTAFGWYQWEGKPSADRLMYFRTNRLYEWK